MIPEQERRLTVIEQEKVPKPAWVMSLEEAALCLKRASEEIKPEMTDAKTRVAYAWLDMARMQKEPSLS